MVELPTESTPMTSIHVTYACRSDVGLARVENEDSLLVADLERGESSEGSGAVELRGRGLLLAVCDGMGGTAGGAVASGLAVTSLRRSLQTMEAPYDGPHLARALEKGVLAAGEAVRSAALRDARLRHMGTTATAAALVGDHLLVAQVGDSRAYVLRGGVLGRLTRDQSLVEQLLATGALKPEDVDDFEHSNVILQALGSTADPVVDLTGHHLRRGDVLLICSDGLWGQVKAPEIIRTIRDAAGLDEAADSLIQQANEAGGVDNVSCVLARFEGPGLQAPTPDDPPPGYHQLHDEPVVPPPPASGERPLSVKPAAPAIPTANASTDDGALALPIDRPGLLSWAVALTCLAALAVTLIRCF
jgi:protein phosphatase